LNEEVGVSSFKGVETDSYLGAQVSIPIFDGFANDYQVLQYQARLEQRRYGLDEARQKVGLDVWNSFQMTETAGRNLSNNVKLLKVALQSHNVAQGSYEAGVGTMIERLEAQSALASARLQWIKALTIWRASRLQLGSDLGTVGLWWRAAH
jgi:outer membrane protein